MSGQFVVSLDFEKYWGMRDHKSIEDYKINLASVDSICLEMLKLFSKYEIHVTWATVGLLAANNKIELLSKLPKTKPNYDDINLSPYNYITEFELEDKFHFDSHIINEICNTKNQELASHTFSHYYCLEPGQNELSFDTDLKLNIEIIKNKFDVDMTSIVFPRNQVNPEYLKILSKNNISTYRGNPTNWIYRLKTNSLLTRSLRLLDSYVNITGNNTYELDKNELPYNIPASYFLRPVITKLWLLERFKMKRIKNQMTHAARNGRLFHLWWHPHNFGNDIQANLVFLEEILNHFKVLKDKYDMKSYSMKEMFKNI